MSKKKSTDRLYENIGAVLAEASAELSRRGIGTPRLELPKQKPPVKRTAPSKPAPKQTMSQKRQHVAELTAEKPRRKSMSVKHIELAEELLKAGRYDEGKRQERIGNTQARNDYIAHLTKGILRKLRNPATRYARETE